MNAVTCQLPELGDFGVRSSGYSCNVIVGVMYGQASSRENMDTWFNCWSKPGEVARDMPTSPFSLPGGSISSHMQTD